MFQHISALAFYLTAVLTLPGSGQHNSTLFGPNLPSYHKLEHHCEREIQQGHAVGAAIAVVENGHITFKKAFGRIRKNDVTQVNTDTVFQLGSTSKSLTAVLFAIAHKRGKISPSTPIAIPNSLHPLIQARNVLSHTTGFKRNGWNWQIEHGAPRSQLLDLFNKRKQDPPGLTYDYHNVAFSLIEQPLAQAFGVTFERALEENLFKPLRMTRTTVGFATFKHQPNRAWPHEKNKQGKYIESEDYSFRYHETVPSAAGINSSINDMAQFLLLNLGQFTEISNSEELSVLHSPLVSASDADRWFKNRLKGDFSCHYGLGFRILKQGDNVMVFHGGSLKGFTSFFAFSPKDKKGIVVLSNTEGGFALSTAVDFFQGKFN